jgi:hypothetical protein
VTIPGSGLPPDALAEEQRDHQQHQEHEEQHVGEVGRTGGDAREAEDVRHQGQDQEGKYPA